MLTKKLFNANTYERSSYIPHITSFAGSESNQTPLPVLSTATHQMRMRKPSHKEYMRTCTDIQIDGRRTPALSNPVAQLFDHRATAVASVVAADAPQTCCEHDHAACRG